MADQLQLRRGNTAQNLAFTGAAGELSYDTTKNQIRVHNGTTAGGFPAATGAQVTDGTFYYNEDAGSAANAYILVPKANTNSPSSYQDGVQFGFVSIHANTGPSTANFQGLGLVSLKYPGGVDPLAGEIFGRIYLIYDATNGWMEIQRKASAPPPQIRAIAASVGSNALTATLQPCIVDFRSASLGNGAVTSLSVTSAITVTAPSGATLGTVSAVQSRIMILAIQGPVNVELALINISGGVNLDETTLINTTAITSGSNLNNVAYSTTARSGVPFRVVGYIESTQATAGTWSTVPSTVQGAGGQAISTMASLGYGQTWQNVTGSRLIGTNYTNTTGKPIFINVSVSSTAATFMSFTINGLQSSVTSTQTVVNNGMAGSIIIPPGAIYIVSVTAGTTTLNGWWELR